MKHLMIALIVLFIAVPVFAAETHDYDSRDVAIAADSHNHSAKQDKIKESFEKLKEGNNKGLFSLIILILFSYGLLHGTGVAHGNAILSGWIMASRQKYRDVLIASLLTGVFHAITAAVVVLSVWFILQKSIDVEKLNQYMRIISGSMVLLIGGYLLFTFVLAKIKGEHVCCHGHDGHEHNKKGDVHPVLLALGAGIVPCPITSTILIASLGMGLVMESIIFIFAFALGMSISLAIIASTVWYLTEKSQDVKFLKYAEMMDVALHFIGPIIVIGIGIFLLSPYIL